MDTSADSTALSDDSHPTQADISGVDSPTPTSDAASAAAGSDPDTSTDTSRNQTLAGSNTPIGTVEVLGRDRSGTIIARPIWDASTALPPCRNLRTRDRQGTISASTSRGAKCTLIPNCGECFFSDHLTCRQLDPQSVPQPRPTKSWSPMAVFTTSTRTTWTTGVSIFYREHHNGDVEYAGGLWVLPHGHRWPQCPCCVMQGSNGNGSSWIFVLQLLVSCTVYALSLRCSVVFVRRYQI